MIIEIVQYNTVVIVQPQANGSVDVVPDNRPEIINIEVVNVGGTSGEAGTLQQVTNLGNTTTNDIEITNENRGIILTNGSARARVTLTDDGFGNLQLTLTQL